MTATRSDLDTVRDLERLTQVVLQLVREADDRLERAQALATQLPGLHDQLAQTQRLAGDVDVIGRGVSDLARDVRQELAGAQEARQVAEERATEAQDAWRRIEELLGSVGGQPGVDSRLAELRQGLAAAQNALQEGIETLAQGQRAVAAAEQARADAVAARAEVQAALVSVDVAKLVDTHNQAHEALAKVKREEERLRGPLERAGQIESNVGRLRKQLTATWFALVATMAFAVAGPALLHAGSARQNAGSETPASGSTQAAPPELDRKASTAESRKELARVHKIVGQKMFRDALAFIKVNRAEEYTSSMLEARSHFILATSLDEENAEAHYNLAVVNNELRIHSEALAELQLAQRNCGEQTPSVCEEAARLERYIRARVPTASPALH